MGHAQPTNPAETYQRYFVPAMFVPWASILLQVAAPQPRERVLDLACGTGIVARQVAPLVGPDGSVTALDLNPAMLDVARALPAPSGAAIDWQEGNALALPFATGSFDVVLCQHGLPFMPDRLAAVHEIRRVVAPTGRAVVMVLQALERHPVFAALGASVARYLALPVDEVMTPFAMWNGDELRALFVAAGFTAVDVRAQSAVARFAEPDRFVPLVVVSSAAAVPAFARLDPPARAALIATVSREITPMLQDYQEADAITFPMFSHVVVATA